MWCGAADIDFLIVVCRAELTGPLQGPANRLRSVETRVYPGEQMDVRGWRKLLRTPAPTGKQQQQVQSFFDDCR